MLKSRMKSVFPDVELWLNGQIDEENELPSLPPHIPGRLIIDLEGVTTINSAGARNWATWIRELKVDKGIRLVRCSRAFIHQSNILVGFLGSEARVVSLFVLYHCDACNNQQNPLITIPESARKAEDIKVQTHIPCSRCGGSMEVDTAPERFFSFVGRMAAAS